MQVTLANPRGFCAGVDRAIDIVNRALEVFGAPVYVRHEVVHNKTVVDDLRDRGAIFVDELDEVPDVEFFCLGDSSVRWLMILLPRPCIAIAGGPHCSAAGFSSVQMFVVGVGIVR